jgi:DNA-binding response OmpR family regulator
MQKSKTVLFVEDDIALRDLLSTVLELGGYDSIPLADGSELMLRATSDTPSLVILDCGLPGIDGVELCKTLKQTASTSHIPVILLTGRTADHDRRRILEAGADAFLAKPFERQELLSTIASCIDRSGLGRGA